MSVMAFSGLLANNDSTDIVLSMNLPDKTFFSNIYTNPTTVFYRPDAFSHGKIETNYSHSTQKNLGLIQEGEQFSQYKITADGFSIKDNKAYWGNIEYSNFRRKNVQWSDVYDYDKLGPYIIADSIGGDSQGEEYKLSGGLSIRHNKWVFGAEAGYIAGQSYRKKDPRPQATSTDIFLRLATSYSILGNYQLGTSFDIAKYREKIGIKSEKNDNNFTFYPLKGFGQYDLRRYKENESTFSWLYEGQRYGVSVFFTPQNKSGFLGKFAFCYESIDSNIDTGSQRNRSPYVYRTYTTQGSLGWQKWQDNSRSFISLNYDYLFGEGIEKLYINERINEIFYETFLLYSARFYAKETIGIKLAGGHEWISKKNVKWITANVTYYTNEEEYSYPQYTMRFERIISSIEFGGEFRTKGKSTFIPKLGLLYSPLQSSRKILPEGERVFDLALKPNIKYFEADLIGLNASLTYQYKLKQIGSIYATMNINYLTDNDNSRYYTGVSVGVKY